MACATWKMRKTIVCFLSGKMLYLDVLLLCFCGINPQVTLGYQNFKTEKRWYLSLCCSDKSLKVNTWSLSICCIQRKINYFRIFHVELLAGNRIVHVELLAGNRIVHDELLAGNYQQAEDLYTGRERWKIKKNIWISLSVLLKNISNTVAINLLGLGILV